MTTNPTPRISVIISTRNRRKLLSETLESVRSQTFSNWECVVVDDASDDDTWEWLSAQPDERFAPIRQTEWGERSKARNAGLEAAKGEYVLFLDDDDLLPAGALQLHLEAHTRHPDAIATVGSYRTFNPRGVWRNRQIVKQETKKELWTDILFGWMAVMGQCLFKKEVIQSQGGFKSEFIPIEDHQLWLKAARIGPAVLLDGYTLNYRIHRGQWRPQDLEELVIKVRQEAIAELPETEQEEAQKILAAREHFFQGVSYIGKCDSKQAKKLLNQVLQNNPAINISPLTGPPIKKQLSYCMAGDIGLRLRQKLRPQQAANRGSYL